MEDLEYLLRHALALGVWPGYVLSSAAAYQGERRSEQEAEPPADRDGQRVEELGRGI